MDTAIDAVGLNDYRAVFEESPNACLLISPALIILGANKAYLRATGRTLASIVGLRYFDAFPEDAPHLGRSRLREALERVIRERRPVTLGNVCYPIPVETPEGRVLEERWWSATHTPVLDERGELRLIVQHPTDITGLRDLQMELGSLQRQNDFYRHTRTVEDDNQILAAERKRLRGLFEQAPGFVAVGQGPDMVFELANEAFYRVVGHRDLMGKPVREALPELEGQGIFELLEQVYSTGEPYVGRAVPMQFRQDPKGGLTTRYVDFIYQPIFDAQGQVCGLFVQGHDVTEAHQLSRELSYQASHDALTGLLSRREFERRLLALATAEYPADTSHALLYLDLDQFKLVNDTCGHQAGDALLRRVAEVLSAVAGEGAVLARLGGDEFALLLESSTREQAVAMAEALRARVEALEFIWRQRRFGTSVSIGLAVCQAEELRLDEALSTADSACFLAKERGRNRVHAHHADDEQLLARRREMDWVGRLRVALEERRLLLYVQRIVPLQAAGEQAMEHWEVLVRLRETDGSIVPPMAFIPAAERYNLMPAVDRYIIRAALTHLAELPSAQRARTAFSINLSANTLNEASFARFVRDEIGRSGVDPAQICFEITETAAVASLVETAKLIGQVKALGCRFALDDFGSGMSSFAYLKQLPVDYLKIDGVFVRQILGNPVDAAMVEAIAKVGAVMGLQTVAEFVENEAMAGLLKDLGVDYAQGYGIHKPEPLST
ncbi:GGDEF and EAL domain-containing protein [Alkalilimnicola sp. S0819]|uniref:sensor domain-containing protein n=1 Tax=Alkalilimnicola sp. S0819 TaxID=2613922 RepID=UPI00128B3005|nr:GGDEF and EAL domain-containing protein [Alkalilimnicola sp. S0819]